MFKFLTEIFEDNLPKATTETIVVAKPYCQPARGLIENIFSKYGVKLHGYKEKIEYVNDLPGLIEATVKVSSKQAVWAEYLLLRSHQFMLMNKPKNQRNLEWASKHNVMPESWNGKPLIEKGCNLKGLKKNGKQNW